MLTCCDTARFRIRIHLDAIVAAPAELNTLGEAETVEACDLRTLALAAAGSGAPYVVLDIVGPGGDGIKLGAG